MEGVVILCNRKQIQCLRVRQLCGKVMSKEAESCAVEGMVILCNRKQIQCLRVRQLCGRVIVKGRELVQ